LLLLQEGDPQMADVALTMSESADQVIVMLCGELDVSGAVSIAASLSQVAASGRHIIVDLDGLQFIDSSGLAALVRARQHARRAGSDLVLSAPQPQVLRMLTLTRLDEVFDVRARAPGLLVAT
jgi:anti-sigma B factor antagonist